MASPLKRKHDDDVVSGTKSKRQTQLGSSTKKIWTKDDELAIFLGILDYENETKLSHSEDWDAFYNFIKGSVESNFSMVQLKDKVRGLKKKYTTAGKQLSFDDSEMFKLSTIIWSSTKSNNMDVPNADHQGVTEDVDQAKDAEIGNGHKEKKTEEQDGVDEFCVLHDAFEALLFPRLSKTQQRLLLHNLRKLEAEKRKELSDEWKALLAEEHRLYIKKLTFATKLAVALE